jgi:hypothetical protein
MDPTTAGADGGGGYDYDDDDDDPFGAMELGEAEPGPTPEELDRLATSQGPAPQNVQEPLWFMQVEADHPSHTLQDWEHVKARHAARVGLLYSQGRYSEALHAADAALVQIDAVIESSIVARPAAGAGGDDGGAKGARQKQKALKRPTGGGLRKELLDAAARRLVLPAPAPAFVCVHACVWLTCVVRMWGLGVLAPLGRVVPRHWAPSRWRVSG